MGNCYGGCNEALPYEYIKYGLYNMSVSILPIKGEKYTPNQVQVSVSKVKINSREEQGLYYCDEKFSYIHSDIEKAIVSIMLFYKWYLLK